MLVLVACCFSASSADLMPPFYPRENNNVGYWDIRDAAIVVNENELILVPPIQYVTGCAWSTLNVPQTSWSIYYNLKIEKPEGGSFAIWVIDEHGAKGSFYGGPESFTGICIYAEIEDGKLKGNMKQSTAHEKTSDFELDITETVTFCLFFNEKEVELKFIAHDSSLVTIQKQPLHVNLTNCWTGITASNGEKVSKIELQAARFSVMDHMEVFRHENQVPVHLKLTPRVRSKRALRNPKFTKIKEEYAAAKAQKGKLGGSKTITDLFDSVLEIDRVTESIAKYRDLSGFVKSTLVPYAHSWQKRSLKIIEITANASVLLSKAFNETEAVIQAWSTDVIENSKKTNSKIDEVHDNFSIDLMNLVSDIDKFVDNSIHEPKYISVLRLIGLAEVAVMIGFVLSNFIHKSEYEQ